MYVPMFSWMRPFCCGSANTYLASGFVLFLSVVLLGNIQQSQVSFSSYLRHLKDVRCILKNNYVLMEVSRPLSECGLCHEVNGPIVLLGDPTLHFDVITQTTTPVLVKAAASNWPAIKLFSFEFFAKIYDEIGQDAYTSAEDECQFLAFKTQFRSLYDALRYVNSSLELENGWYIGWSNCHPKIREILRSYYPKFLPINAESSALDWIFMGSPGPATTMHIDYVLRPSWQAQISGTKLWKLMPPPECESFCKGFNFTVEKGDIDTNQWYHDTYVLPEGGFSISVGSEYD